MRGKWIIQDNHIALSVGNEILHPSADELYAVMGKCEGNFVEGIDCDDINSSFPKIRFSKVGSDIRCRLINKDDKIQIELFCDRKGNEVPVDVIQGQIIDQCICGSEWFYVTGSTKEIEKLLFTAEIQTCGIITMSQYVEILRNKDFLLSGSMINLVETSLLNKPINEEDALPRGIEATLYSYQKIGYLWMKYMLSENQGCILGDEMGLGKTLQVITLMQDYKNQGRVPMLVLLSLNGTASDIGNNIKKAAEAVQDIHDNYLMDDNTEADENSIVNNVRKFRKEFSEAIQDDEIQSITVLIDDLDRCQPDRIIETLEAIKLFLSVDKMTFIIAADENVIQYSIRKKYPPLDNYAVNLDKEYIEKIIQLPIYIPELSTRDIENYLMLLVAQQYCSTEQFRAFLDGIRESKMMISETTIDQAKLKELIRDYLHIELSKDFAELADVISGIKGIVASNLKGNPRQAKRFMNTFITKKKLAELYYGLTEINSKTLAKLLVLQKLDNDLFIQLNEWNKRFSTENEEFKKMRLNVLEGTSEDEKYNAWRNPSIRRWLESEPIELEKTRLDRYFYLTRENLKKADVDVSTLSVSAKEILERIGSATRSLIDSITDDMKALTPSDKNAVFSVVLPKIEKGEIELFVVRNLFVSFEAYREKIVTALEKYPGKIAIGSFAALKAMRNADKRKIDDLLDVWQKAGIIDQKGIDSIKSKEKK